MYGVDPFDQGLDQLAEAALIDDAEAAGAASPAIPHAYAVPVGLNEGGAAAAPTILASLLLSFLPFCM